MGKKLKEKKSRSKLPSMHGGAFMGVSSFDWKILGQTFDVPCNGQFCTGYQLISHSNLNFHVKEQVPSLGTLCIANLP
jgi:hypothetical protein